MKTNRTRITKEKNRARFRSFALISILLVAAVLACTRLSGTAGAQSLTWNESDVAEMWNGYVSDFYNKDGAGYYVFNPQAGDATITGFWEEAEEIEMAEDGYDWATRENNSFGNASDIGQDKRHLHWDYQSQWDSLVGGYVRRR